MSLVSIYPVGNGCARVAHGPGKASISASGFPKYPALHMSDQTHRAADPGHGLAFSFDWCHRLAAGALLWQKPSTPHTVRVFSVTVLVGG